MNQAQLIENHGKPRGNYRMALVDLLKARFDMPSRRSAERFAGLLEDNWDDIKKLMES